VLQLQSNIRFYGNTAGDIPKHTRQEESDFQDKTAVFVCIITETRITYYMQYRTWQYHCYIWMCRTFSKRKNYTSLFRFTKLRDSRPRKQIMSDFAVWRTKRTGQLCATVKQQVISTNIDLEPDPVRLGESEYCFPAEKKNCVSVSNSIVISKDAWLVTCQCCINYSIYTMLINVTWWLCRFSVKRLRRRHSFSVFR
jgi:hypothetical protein